MPPDAPATTVFSHGQLSNRPQINGGARPSKKLTSLRHDLDWKFSKVGRLREVLSGGVERFLEVIEMGDSKHFK